MVFAKILDDIHQCLDLATHSSGSWIRIRIPNGKFSRKLLQNRIFRENENFRETFRKNENFRENENFRKLFREKRKKFSRKYENENFLFNPTCW
jgi:hypothetical protein